MNDTLADIDGGARWLLYVAAFAVAAWLITREDEDK